MFEPWKEKKSYIKFYLDMEGLVENKGLCLSE